MNFFAIFALALAYEQPKYKDFLQALSSKKSGWGHPVDRIAALYTLCSPLETPINGEVTCDQSTCALVCDQGQLLFLRTLPPPASRQKPKDLIFGVLKVFLSS